MTGWIPSTHIIMRSLATQMIVRPSIGTKQESGNQSELLHEMQQPSRTY